ncbi:MAG: hypothetical protein J6V10_09370 [Clostridia bacterium]|nr:hypothetical protein [Clostridia bacterium]
MNGNMKRIIPLILVIVVCVLAACQHTHSFGEWEVVKNPTCTESGTKERWCSCGEKQSEEIPATGHIEIIDQGTEATCTSTGKTEGKHCSICGKVIVFQTSIPATGHKYQLISDTATCTEDGKKEYKCSVCSDTYSVASVALGHKYSGSKITKQPTCTEPGEKSYECTKCHQSLTEQIEPLGHEYSLKSTKEATCTEDGEKIFVCSRCNHSYSEPIRAEGHSYDAGKITKQPTCTEAGVRTITCTKCRQSYTEALVALGHNFVNGTCSRCGVNNIKILVSKSAPFTIENWASATFSKTIIEISKLEVSMESSKIVIEGVACITNFITSNQYASPSKMFYFELFDEDGVKVEQTLVNLSTQKINEKVSFSSWISITNLKGTYTLKCVPIS